MNDDLADLLRGAAAAAQPGPLDVPAMTRTVRRRRRARAAASGAVALVVAVALGTTAAAVAPHVLPRGGSTAAGLPAADGDAPAGTCGSVVTAADLAQGDPDLVLGVFAGGTGYGPTSTPVGEVGAGMGVTARGDHAAGTTVSAGAAFLLQGDVVVARVGATSGNGLPAAVPPAASLPSVWLVGRIPTTSCSSGRPLQDGDYVLAGAVAVSHDGQQRVVVAGGEKVTLVGGARAEGCTAGLPAATDDSRTLPTDPLQISLSRVPDAPAHAWAVRMDLELHLDEALDPAGTQVADAPDVYLVDGSGTVAARSDTGSMVGGRSLDWTQPFLLGLEPTFRACDGAQLTPGTYHVLVVWRLQRPEPARLVTAVSDVGVVTVPQG